MRHFPAKKRSVVKITERCEVMSVSALCRMPEEDRSKKDDQLRLLWEKVP